MDLKGKKNVLQSNGPQRKNNEYTSYYLLFALYKVELSIDIFSLTMLPPDRHFQIFTFLNIEWMQGISDRKSNNRRVSYNCII